MNGDDSSGKVTKRDTSENDRNRKAYRSGTVSLAYQCLTRLGQPHWYIHTYLQHSENRYGKGQHEEEGSAGSEEEDFFKKVRSAQISEQYQCTYCVHMLFSRACYIWVACKGCPERSGGAQPSLHVLCSSY